MKSRKIVSLVFKSTSWLFWSVHNISHWYILQLFPSSAFYLTVALMNPVIYVFILLISCQAFLYFVYSVAIYSVYQCFANPTSCNLIYFVSFWSLLSLLQSLLCHVSIAYCIWNLHSLLHITVYLTFTLFTLYRSFLLYSYSLPQVHRLCAKLSLVLVQNYQLQDLCLLDWLYCEPEENPEIPKISEILERLLYSYKI